MLTSLTCKIGIGMSSVDFQHQRGEFNSRGKELDRLCTNLSLVPVLGKSKPLHS